MKSISFTIKSSQSLRIGEVLQAELFECNSFSAKDAGLKPSADSLISYFNSFKPIRYLFQIWRQLLTGLGP